MKLYELDVLVHGKKIKKYCHEGLLFVEGRPQTEYSVRFVNNTCARVLAVISVDGLSVMDGEEAELDSHGYVVNPFDSLVVPGWRLDNDGVAKFTFNPKGRSYANKTGKPSNTGVIGCLVFTEKQNHDPWYLEKKYLGEGPFPIAYGHSFTSDGTGPFNWSVTTSTTAGKLDKNSPPATTNTLYHNEKVYKNADFQRLGTEFGEQKPHKVVEVEFNRSAQPTTLLEIYYDDRSGLERRGIYLGKAVKAEVARSFKDYRNTKKTIGCTPPKGWKHSNTNTKY